ncbi:uncharacterized protein [Miscanthus floridulus]|uniref:uncharacterized protein isoform X2 n=1 Tax=Miscanthus floridulus TaxID=154761 RepID=UPI003457DBAA
MPGWIIEGFELATNPTKLWRALRKPKEAKNSPAGVRKEGSERNEAHRRPYCRKRGRSLVIVLLLVLLALAVTAAEGSQDDHVEMPPPPGGSLRQQLSEQDLRSIHRSTDDTIKYLETLIRRGREAAKRRREEAKEMEEVADELQERVKVLRQVWEASHEASCIGTILDFGESDHRNMRQ